MISQTIPVPHMVRPSRRMMVFVDGENLVCRYQAMCKEGYIPREGIFHDPDVAVWDPSFTFQGAHHEILRVTYYASVVGAEVRVNEVCQRLRGQTFAKHDASFLPNSLTPCVFKKPTHARQTKGLDIQLCVDVLGHVYRNNVDAVLLLTGDADYAPLINDVLRAGKQVFVSAFSSGLSPRLKEVADEFYCLDGTTWRQSPETKT